MVTFRDKLFEHCRSHTLEALGAVVSADMKLRADGGHLFGVDEKAFVAGAYDDFDVSAALVKPLGLGIDRCGAYASGDEYIAL